MAWNPKPPFNNLLRLKRILDYEEKGHSKEREDLDGQEKTRNGNRDTLSLGFLPTKVFQGFIEAYKNHIQIIGKRFRIKKGLLQVDQPRVSQTNKLQFPQIPKRNRDHRLAPIPGVQSPFLLAYSALI
jgi:hypothetical protein